MEHWHGSVSNLDKETILWFAKHAHVETQYYCANSVNVLANKSLGMDLSKDREKLNDPKKYKMHVDV